MSFVVLLNTADGSLVVSSKSGHFQNSDKPDMTLSLKLSDVTQKPRQ